MSLQSTQRVAVESLEARQLMAGQRLFFENFEGGGNGWHVDTELAIDQSKAWAVTSGRAHSGSRAAGTVRPGIDAVMASPVINLPAVDQYKDHLYLKWWQWTDYSSRGGQAASMPVIRQWSPDLGGWGPWNVIDPNTDTAPQQTKTWGYSSLDMTGFAGSQVQVGFHHYGFTNGAPGWFVDDVEVTREQVQRPWNGDTGFENGFDGWSTTRGIWDIGNAGGNKVASTGVLGSPMPGETSSLISPAFFLLANTSRQPVTLSFRSYLDIPQSAIMTVEFQFWMPTKRAWSPPNNISADGIDTVLNISQPAGRWTTFTLPLTSSLGGAHIVPHRLLFTAMTGINGGRGWTIDDVRLNFPGKSQQPTPTAARPEVVVFNPFGELTNNVTTVRWGTYNKNTGGKDITFTIRNTGKSVLQLGPVALDKNIGFVIVTQPARTVNPGAATTFKLRLLTSTTGTKSATVRFASNDLDESTYRFNISGLVK